MSSANTYSPVSSLTTPVTVIDFFFKIELVTTSRTVWNNSKCFLILVSVPVSELIKILAFRLRYVFYTVKYPHITVFSRDFIKNGCMPAPCWILPTAFSASIAVIIWCLLLNTLRWWAIFIGFRILHYLWIPVINPALWLCIVCWYFIYCVFIDINFPVKIYQPVIFLVFFFVEIDRFNLFTYPGINFSKLYFSQKLIILSGFSSLFA